MMILSNSFINCYLLYNYSNLSVFLNYLKIIKKI